MLEPPDISDGLIIARLQAEFGLRAGRVTFLPLGVDVRTAVYRVDADDGAAYFLKLRLDPWDEMVVAVPRFLDAQGVPSIIAPLATRAGQGWGRLDEYRMILYPFVEAHDGYEVALSDAQWFALGRAVAGIHAADVPPALRARIRREDWSPHWRDQVRRFQAQVADGAFADPVAERLAALMRTRRGEIARIVDRAGELGRALAGDPPEFVLCHSDLHAGNLLICADGALYIVDWDAPSLAPRERDLMCVGMGGAGIGSAAPEGREEALFYAGYGPVTLNRTALAYYRYERIAQDIAEFCQQIFGAAAGREDREQAYRYFAGQFEAGNVIDVAFGTDPGGV